MTGVKMRLWRLWSSLSEQNIWSFLKPAASARTYCGQKSKALQEKKPFAIIVRPLVPAGLYLLGERRFCRAPENFTVFYPTKSINIGQTKPWIYMKACFILVLFLHSHPLVRMQQTINLLSLRNTEHFEGFSNFQRFISLFNFLF